MLENLKTSEEINQWRSAEGVNFREIAVAALSSGSVFRVETKSGNAYLFEVADPKKCEAHVVRCQPSGFAPAAGYRGLRTISPIIKVGKQVWHDSSSTSPAVRITVIRKNA